MVDLSARITSDGAQGSRAETALRIGILLPGTPNRFFDKITSGMRSMLVGERPHQLLLVPSDFSRPDDTASLDALIDAGVDALVVVAPRLSPQQLDDAARRMPWSSHP